ncbi:MAG: hypothetical protein ABID84_01610 [Chloroflexota bacterium]
MNEKEEAELINKWTTENDEVVLHYFPKENRMVLYPSAWDYVMVYLKQYGMMAVSTALKKAVHGRIRYLETIAREGHPQGRPLSLERDIARRLLAEGESYEAVLGLLKDVRLRPGLLQHSDDYTFGEKKVKRVPTRAQAKSIRNSLDREWKLQRDTTSPIPPSNWWKDPVWRAGPENALDSAIEGGDDKVPEEWLTERDEFVLHFFPKQDMMRCYGSPTEFVEAVFAKQHMVAECPPLFNAALSHLDRLERIVGREPPSGRPLSSSRRVARHLISKGLPYHLVLWMVKGLASTPLMAATDDAASTEHEPPPTLSASQAHSIRHAVDREWFRQHNEVPPAPDRNWWKESKPPSPMKGLKVLN